MNGLTTDPEFDNVTIPRVPPHVPVEPTPTLPVSLPAPFITADELKTHIYEAVANAITDGDDEILPQAISAATQEAMGYMSRYDYMTILSQTGSVRDPILLLYIKDIAVYHFMVLANPNIDYEIRYERYKMAIRWLEKIQSGRFVPAGWPPASPTYLSTQWHIKSRDKRGNNY